MGFEPEAGSLALTALFGSEVRNGASFDGVGKYGVFKEFSQDMQNLYDNDYFKDVNFLPGNRFYITCFHQEYARDYVKRASTKRTFLCGFQVAMQNRLHCLAALLKIREMSLLPRNFVPSSKLAKNLLVCSRCVLRNTCKYLNKSMGDHPTLRLDSLLRLLRAYSLEEISPKHKLTDDIKACVSQLIREVIELSKGSEQTRPL